MPWNILHKNTFRVNKSAAFCLLPYPLPSLRPNSKYHDHVHLRRCQQPESSLFQWITYVPWPACVFDKMTEQWIFCQPQKPTNPNANYNGSSFFCTPPVTTAVTAAAMSQPTWRQQRSKKASAAIAFSWPTHSSKPSGIRSSVAKTLLYNTSLQPFSPTLPYKTLPQPFSSTRFSNTSLQHPSPTLLYNTLIQDFPATLFSKSFARLLYDTLL